MLVDLKDATREFRISTRYAKKLVSTGRWPAFQLGPRIIRVDPDQIKKLTAINGGQLKCPKLSGGYHEKRLCLLRSCLPA